MPWTSEPGFLVLHGLRVKGLTDHVRLASAFGLRPGVVESHLRDLEAGGLATSWTGAVSGWSITSAGRAAHRRLVDDELLSSGCRSALAGAHARFVELNEPAKRAITEWQLTPPDDGRGREEVIERLAGIDGAAQDVCAVLAASLSRFGLYGSRLARALGEARSGDGAWIARPDIDSYHTVWFELHEDLLATLGLERSTEVDG